MKILKTLACTALLTTSAATMAGPITVDAGWYGFCFFGGPGSPAIKGCQNLGVDREGNPFTFSLAGPGLLKITDAFDIGDTFDIWINSAFALTTSNPGAGSYTEDPDQAFSSGYYSAGSIMLAAGAYSVDIFANQSPFGGGGAYVEVETKVPVAGTLALVGLGLAALGFGSRKRA